MSLNKSKGHMYKFITHTWNPLGGDCMHGCTYCSTNKFYYQVLKDKYSGPLRLYENYLNDNLGNDKFIFVCSQHDLFAKNVPDDTIKQILDHCNKFDSKYLFQSKNVARMELYVSEGLTPPNSVFCTTIESNIIYPDIYKQLPNPDDRAIWLNEIAHAGFKTFVTIEPILEFEMNAMLWLIQKCLPEQVNIGADSGNNGLPEPDTKNILELIRNIRKFSKVNIKDNLKRLM